jgi:chloride channel 7
MDSDDE